MPSIPTSPSALPPQQLLMTPDQLLLSNLILELIFKPRYKLVFKPRFTLVFKLMKDVGPSTGGPCPRPVRWVCTLEAMGGVAL